MPGVIANVIFLIKESSVVSAIALADIMYEAKDIMGNDYNTYEALCSAYSFIPDCAAAYFPHWHMVGEEVRLCKELIFFSSLPLCRAF